jgi:hypothetical protein
MSDIQPKIIKFIDIKEDLINALNKKIRNKDLILNEKITIVDGFVNQPMSVELSGAFVIGGPTVPMIMLVGDMSGRIYYFALKAILPEIAI